MAISVRLPIGEHYLTIREVEIVWHCANGLTTDSISQKLFISPDTVKRHKDNIRARLKLGGYNCLREFASQWKNELEKCLLANQPF